MYAIASFFALRRSYGGNENKRKVYIRRTAGSLTRGLIPAFFANKHGVAPVLGLYINIYKTKSKESEENYVKLNKEL